jgi:O-antigen/teichoic acid export membrane protein
MQVSGQLIVATGDAVAGAWSAIFGAATQLAVLVVWLVVSTLTPASAMGIALVGFLATAGFVTVTLGKRAGAGALRPRWSRQLGGALLRNAVALHPGGVALQLGSRIDLLIVGALATARSAGLYSLALALASSMYVVTQTLALSAIHTQMNADIGTALRFTARFTRQAAALALLTTVAVCALAYPFITLVYGAHWRGSVLPFMALVIATIAMAIEEPVRQMLIRVGRPSETSVAACVSVLLNAVATVVLFQLLGIAGAALGSIVAFWIYAAMMVRLLVRVSGTDFRELIAFPRRGDPLFELVSGAMRHTRPHST